MTKEQEVQIDGIKRVQLWLGHRGNQEIIQSKWDAAIEESAARTSLKRQPFFEIYRYLVNLIGDNTTIWFHLHRSTTMAHEDFDQAFDIAVYFEWDGKETGSHITRVLYSDNTSNKIDFDAILKYIVWATKDTTGIDISKK